ncbi:hypothetical protein [Granulicella sp. WH15]|uniref:aldose epimerase family protein n=1 Tax=Granulicella sp. WH15 TaxID=2602070 RepID=UPI0013A550CB|nr:hypothetical protein [Granulicella sp. WH15]
MEETRVLHMYLNLLKKRLIATWDYIAGGGWMRSGSVTTVLLALILGTAFFIIHERGKGHLTQLRNKMEGDVRPPVASGPKPGGVEPLVLTRPQPTGQTGPEFASVTLLPGLGMSVLQMTAFVPGHGEIPLLAAPTAEQLVSTPPPAAQGPNDDHGAFELPWSGALIGSPAPVGDRMVVRWQEQAMTLPSAATKPSRAYGGLLRRQAAGEVTQDVVPDGTSATATFTATDFDGDWPGKIQTKVSVVMVGSRMDLSVIATNSGSAPLPIGIGWHPRFAIRGDRKSVSLKLPEASRMETSEITRGMPTGKTLSAGSQLEQFMGKQMVALGNTALNDLLVEMKPSLLEDGPIAEMRFPSEGYGIRMRLVSASIRSLRVVADPAQPYLSLGPQVNFDDPLGHQWDRNMEMPVLAPGASMEWRIKLDLFPLTGQSSSLIE